MSRGAFSHIHEQSPVNWGFFRGDASIVSLTLAVTPCEDTCPRAEALLGRNCYLANISSQGIP